MTGAVYIVDCLLEQVCESKGPKFDTLKKNKKPLAPEERERVMAAGAVWGDNSSAVWKAVVGGKTWYVCSTHRAYRVKPTLKGAIASYKWVETTA